MQVLQAIHYSLGPEGKAFVLKRTRQWLVYPTKQHQMFSKCQKMSSEEIEFLSGPSLLPLRPLSRQVCH